MKNIRESKVDFLRVIAILLVVNLHIVEGVFPVLHGGSAGAIDTTLAVTMETACQLGVPFFLIISGYLLLDRDFTRDYTKKFYANNLLPLIVSYIVWSAVYFINQNAIGKHLSLLDYIGAVILIKAPMLSHLWFMQMIIGVYVVLPIIAIALRKIQENDNETAFWPAFVIALIFCSILPSCQSVLEYLKLNINLTDGVRLFGSRSYSLLYLIIGYLIKKHKKSLRKYKTG